MSHRFNPRAPHGARLVRPVVPRDGAPVSIHAPRTGRDRPDPIYAYTIRLVSIHAPRTGRDEGGLSSHGVRPVSIHAPRTGRDIPSRVGVGCFSRGFNPRAPHGARRHDGGGGYRRPGVSIHAPRTGRDKQRRLTNLPLGVSIHAPRTGRDLKFWLWLGR